MNPVKCVQTINGFPLRKNWRVEEEERKIFFLLNLSRRSPFRAQLHKGKADSCFILRP